MAARRTNHSKRVTHGGYLILVGVVLATSGWATSQLQENIQFGSSVSQAYDARSILTNPAAMAFQTELNGTGLLCAFSYGFTKEWQDQFSLTLGLGYFGLAAEQISAAEGAYSRYSLGASFPISSTLFWGSRFSFTRSSVGSLDGFTSLDLGLQYRPLSILSLGLLAKSLNQPDHQGTKIPIELALGATFRPIDSLGLSVDVITNSQRFGNDVTYQGTASYRLFRGFKLHAGYHEAHEFLFGAQFNLTNLSFFTTIQPKSGHQAAIAGTQIAFRPYPSAIHPTSAVKVAIDHSLQERPSSPSLFSKARPSLIDLITTLNKTKNRPGVALIIVNIQKFPLGLAAAQDIFDVLWDLRQQGKRIEVYLGNAGTKEYLIASAAHHIYIKPDGELRLTGLRSERYYVKGTLDKLGIKGEFLAKGKYKSAPETFTRRKSSTVSKEATLQRLRHARQELLKVLVATRNISSKKWSTILDHALYSPEEAKKSGLVDGIGGLAQNAEAYKRYWIHKTVDEQRDLLWLPPRVAIIVASGDILQRKHQILSLAGHPQVTPKIMKKQIQAALADSRTKAIVLRVNSPGGEILASREIASLIEQAQTKKPFVVSMGDVAASGGYFISTPAKAIFAQPLSITGSIGVFMGKFNLGGLYKKIELKKEILSDAPHADLFSEDRPWTKKQFSILKRRLNQYYDGFTSYVSQQRKISQQAVEKAAQGRVWLGTQAKSHQLIDKVGGFSDAIAYAAKQGGLKENRYDIWAIRKPSSLFNLFGEDSWLAQALTPTQTALSMVPELARQTYWATRGSEQPFLYFAPIGKTQ